MPLSHSFIKSLDVDYSQATGESGSVRNPLLSIYMSILNGNLTKYDIVEAEHYGIKGLIEGREYKYDNLSVFHRETNNYYAHLRNIKQ